MCVQQIVCVVLLSSNSDWRFEKTAAEDVVLHTTNQTQRQEKDEHSTQMKGNWNDAELNRLTPSPSHSVCVFECVY